MGLLKAKDLLHHIDRLQDFIILEAAEDADGNVSRDEIEHNLMPDFFLSGCPPSIHQCVRFA